MRHRNEGAVFAMLSLAVLAYATARAVLVPMVHDEATSFLAYVQSGEFLPFRAMWDANNHYLSSALGILAYKAFGLHLISLRAASLLSFIPFAWGAWRIGSSLHHPLVRWSLWLALLASPLLLDFFSLFRGYGPAMAALLIALDGMLRFLRTGARNNLLQALIAMAIATAFVLALIPLWVVMIALLLPKVLHVRCLMLLWLILGMAPLLGAVGLAFLMARFGLLYHGSTEGYFAVTVLSLIRYALGVANPGWALLIASGVAAAILTTGWRAWRTRDWASPGIIIATLLVGEMLLRIVLALAFGINHAEDRAALHVLVLAVICVAFAADAWAETHPAAALLALPLLVLPARTIVGVNTDRTVLWPEQSTPDCFLRTVWDLERALGRPAVVGAYRLQGLTWSLQQRMLGGEGDICALGFPQGEHDIRVVDERFLPGAMVGYREVDHSPGNGLRLLVRERPLQTETLLDTAFALSMRRGMSTPAFELPPRLASGHDLLIEIGARMRSPEAPINPRLALEVIDSAGTRLFADLVFLSTRRAAWGGEHWRTIRWVSQQSEAAAVRITLWSEDLITCEAYDGRVVVHALKH